MGICIALVAGVMVATDADARRLGGGRSAGVQRNVTPAPAKPAQQQAAPKQNPQTQQPQAQPSRWGMLGGILGGLALGGLLGYLFGGNGLGGLLILALLAVAVVFMLRAMARRRAEQHPVQLAAMGGSPWLVLRNAKDEEAVDSIGTTYADLRGDAHKAPIDDATATKLTSTRTPGAGDPFATSLDSKGSDSSRTRMVKIIRATKEESVTVDVPHAPPANVLSTKNDESDATEK